MNELSKTENMTLAMQTPAEVIGTTIAKAVTIMLGAGLKTYGQMPTLDAWFLVLKGKANVIEIEAATEHFCSAVGADGKAPEMPAAAQFRDWIMARRRDLEREQELVDMAEYIRLEDRSGVEARNIKRYGTPDPTREQIEERLAKYKLDPSAPRVPQVVDPFRMNRTELVDPAQASRVAEQIAKAKENS